MNGNIHQIVKDRVFEIVANIGRFFQCGELAYLSYENKIETILKNKIAWELQKHLDDLSAKRILPESYLVKMEWSPGEKRKCDMAVLQQDKITNNDYSEVIAMFELKFTSLQKAEKLYEDEFVKDINKMVDFCNKELHGRKDQIDIYYLFFQQLLLQPIKDYRNAFTYVKLIDSCFGKAKEQRLGKQNEVEKIEDYWKNKVFSNVSIKGSNGSSWKRVEIDLGNYFNHSSFLETAIWGPAKADEIVIESSK